MQPVVLATKITIPPAARRAVRRTRLLEILEREMSYVKLGLVMAEAGAGKSTLLAHWARSSRMVMAWVSLDGSDSDLEGFYRYLLAAWEKVQPGVSDSPLGVLLSGMMPDSKAVRARFINQANELDRHTVFILDDFHLISEPAVHQELAFLLDHLPPKVHFVLSCRTEPPLPLARYRARQELFELHSEKLRLSAEETAAFLTTTMGLKLEQEEINRLHSQCEGWVAGLQLAALSLQRGSVSDRPVSASGRQRFIADYLAQDVLAEQPPDVRDFLLRTSILERLSASLCGAVIASEGDEQMPAAQKMLEKLERDNLFLEPLDDSREWFRYHHLFAEFLRSEARQHLPHELAILNRRAAEWHLTHDYPNRAFDHAVAAGDLDLVIRVAERYFFVLLHGGEFHLLNEWLEALPAAWYEAYPTFSLARAGLLAFTGATEASMRLIEQVEEKLVPPKSENARWQLARATAVRCFHACYHNDIPQAEKYAARALEALREDDLTFRADTYHALGDAYRRDGRWQESKQCYLKVLEFASAPTYNELSIHAFGALADLELRQGRLHRAARCWQKALHALEKPESWGRMPLSISGWAHIRMAEILYEWNELQEAEELLVKGLQRAELGGDVRAQIAGALLASRLNLTHGNVEAANEYLELAGLLLADTSFEAWKSRHERLQLELWLAEERLRVVVQWADEAQAALMPPAPGHPFRGEDFSRVIALARVLIIKGDGQSVQQARGLLDRLFQLTEEEGRMGLLIEALALDSLARWRQGDRARALISLERALRLAQPEGYSRLFADLGLPMARLLQEAQSRDVLPDMVQELLAAFEQSPLLPGTEAKALPEPLTDREQEVLRLLAAGLTNREIGEKLVISPQTVKKHASNIYGKLAVGSRMEAVSRARELNLLD